MEITGKIKFIKDTQTFGDNGFKKRELILMTEDQYPQILSIEFLKDSVFLLDRYKEGQEVSISINLKGREWTNSEGVTKYFNSIIGWRIQSVESNQDSQNPRSFETSSDTLDNTEEDDLPF